MTFYVVNYLAIIYLIYLAPSYSGTINNVILIIYYFCIIKLVAVLFPQIIKWVKCSSMLTIIEKYYGIDDNLHA